MKLIANGVYATPEIVVMTISNDGVLCQSSTTNSVTIKSWSNDDAGVEGIWK